MALYDKLTLTTFTKFIGKICSSSKSALVSEVKSRTLGNKSLTIFS
jgi:hypothetical protein